MLSLFLLLSFYNFGGFKMETTIHEIAISNNLMDIVSKMLSMLLAKQVLFTIVIAILTYGILDIILKNDIGVMKMPKIPQSTKRIATKAIFHILSVFIPIAYILQSIFSNSNISFSGILIATLIGITAGLITGYLFKQELPKGHSGKTKLFPVVDAIAVIFEKLSDFIIGFLQTIATGLLVGVIKLINGPLVVYYATVAVILNLAISAGLIFIIGDTQGSAVANVAGSAVGGIAHYLIRRNLINERKEIRLKEIKNNETKI